MSKEKPYFSGCNSNPEFLWMIVKKWNSFRVKKRDIKRAFSVEPNNLTNCSTFRCSGLIHRKTLAVGVGDKGRVKVTYKRKKYRKQPNKMLTSIELKGGARAQLHSLKNFIVKNNYRRDLLMPALRRASALLDAHARTIKMNKAKAKKGD